MAPVAAGRRLDFNVSGTWGVFLTQTAREVSVTRRLTDAGFPAYCPLETVRNGKRRCWEERPLYPSYIFAAYNDEFDRHAIARTRDVIERVPMFSHEAEDIRRHLVSLDLVLSQQHYISRVGPDRFHAGDPVEVVAGPLMGARGVLIRKVEHIQGVPIPMTTLVVGIASLGGAELSVDADDCEPVEA